MFVVQGLGHSLEKALVEMGYEVAKLCEVGVQMTLYKWKGKLGIQKETNIPAIYEFISLYLIKINYILEYTFCNCLSFLDYFRQSSL